MEILRNDVRYALRQMRLAPVFTLTALLTLSLGIGATTAIFSLVHRVMLKSLPVADPASLYRIGSGMDCCVWGMASQRDLGVISYSLYKRFVESASQFEDMAAFQASPVRFNVRRSSENVQATPSRAEFVSGNYFRTFGVGAFTGRALTPADDRPAATPVAMLSYRAWQQEYGSDPSIVGSSFIIEGHPFVIIGIAPPGFFGETLRSDPPDIWMPLQQEPMVNGANSMLRQPFEGWLRVIGRLKPGAMIAGTAAQLSVVFRQWLPTQSDAPAAFLPEIVRTLSRQHVNVVPAGAGVKEMQADYGKSLRLLLAFCSLVLLIACANIANLLLARGMARRAQTSLQLALGASRHRLIRQSITESILLALLGGVGGVIVAYLGTQFIIALAFTDAHVMPFSAAPSWPVLAFCFGLSLITGVIFGAAPAWFRSQAEPAEALRGVNRSTRDRSAMPQKALVIVQATLSVVLLAGAGLLTHSLLNLEDQDFGFATAGRVSVLMNQPPASYTPERLNALNRELQDRLSHLPGARSASVALYSPFSGDSWEEYIVKQGEGAPQPGKSPFVLWNRVSPTYFETIGQKVLRGRGITEDDDSRSRAIAVVNQAFVRQFYRDQDPIGKHFGLDLPANSGDFEIVGVVNDAKYYDAGAEPKPMFFAPLTQTVTYNDADMRQTDTRSHFIQGAQLWTTSDLGTLEPLIRKAFSEVDPNLTINNIQTMRQQVDISFDQQRAVAKLTGLFGLLALALAGIGLYGVTAYNVERRTSEVGVRMALGANRMDVIRLVLRGAFTQVAIGLAIGIPLTVAAARLISSELYGITSWDPLSLAVAIAALACCAFTASIIPAQRASSIEPVNALRVE